MAAALQNKAFPSVKLDVPIFQIVPFAGGRVRLILGKKQQNQQNPARERTRKSLKLIGNALGMVVGRCYEEKKITSPSRGFEI
jgi:hypothetical protein